MILKENNFLRKMFIVTDLASLMGTSANSEDLDVTSKSVTFYQCLLCLL